MRFYLYDHIEDIPRRKSTRGNAIEPLPDTSHWVRPEPTRDPHSSSWPGLRRTATRVGLLVAFLLLLALAWLFPRSLSAQEPLPAHRLEVEITIDGHVDEAGWDDIPPLDITQKVPVEGAPPSQPTEIRIAYDDDYIYLSGRLFDADPAEIIANTKKRDDFTENTAWVGLLIDTYDDRENALGFWVTPTGSRLDMAIGNDGQGPAAINTSWNAFWDAAVTRDGRGWFAEIRIPFSSLPFQSTGGRTVMGITTWRYIARTDETAIYPPRGLPSGSSFRPSLTQRFVFEGVNANRQIRVTPYALGGLKRSHLPSQPAGTFELDHQLDAEMGLDVQVGLGSNATVDVTVNTDFAEVEVDDQQVNLGRSRLFFPEKRLFFQERASLFDFTFGPADRLFHSRRVGIVGGEQTRIYGGLRAITKVGRWETGILTMQTGPKGGVESENMSVFRIKGRVLNENSSVGAMVTNRTDLSGSFNTVYGLDATLRVTGDQYVSARWAQSFADQAPDRPSRLDGSRYFLQLTDRSPQGFTYTLDYGRSGIAFDPGLGFQGRDDVAQLTYNVAYNAFPPGSSRFVQYGPYHTAAFTWRNETGTRESRSLRGGVLTFTKAGWTSDTYVQADHEVLSAPLLLAGEARVEPGSYAFTAGGGTLTTPSALRLSGSLTASAGSFYGGSKLTVRISPFYNVTPDLTLQGSFGYDRISLPSLEMPLVVRLTQAKFEYTLSTKLSVGTLVQHNNVDHLVVGSLRLRYNPKEGNDLYVVFNGDLNEDRNRGLALLPLSNGATLRLKYNYTFRP